VVQIGRGSILWSSLTVPNHVRVSSVGDSHAAGRARLKLKLAAIGYVNTRHGIDADVGLSRAGLALLTCAAVEYYAGLTGADMKGRSASPARQLEDLQLAAIAYVNARHGVDADVGLARTGLALLAQAAIAYGEAIIGADPKQRPVDPHLQLGNGI
jgi:hypothetical protein